MLEKHQWPTCTGTPSTCTGTPMLKSGREKHVPVHLQPVPVHLCRKVAETNLYGYNTNLYRYICVRIAGIEQEFDSNVRARLSINFQCGITLKGGIKARGYNEKAAFDS